MILNQLINKRDESESCEFCREFNENTIETKEKIVLHAYFSGNRIISSKGRWNLIPTLGCFKVGYTLLVNHEHFLSLYHCPEKDKEMFLCFMDDLKMVYREVFHSEYIMFEHGIVDESVTSPNSVNHVHLHFLPYGKGAYDLTPVLEKQYQLKVLSFSSIFDLNRIIEEKRIKSYLLYYVSEQYHIVDIGTEQLPSQFLRKVLYNLEGFEDDGWDWKKEPFYDEMLVTYRLMKK